MNIAVIGSGNVGGALSKGWTKAGHKVYLGARNKTSDRVKELLAFNSVLPPTAVVEIAKGLGELTNKIVIDATNSVFAKPEPYNNASEALRDLTKCQNVVKCFNSTGFENMEDPVYNGQNIDMFVAGDSVKGKEIAIQLSIDLGCAECYDFGGDEKIDLLEQFAMAWINLATIQKHG